MAPKTSTTAAYGDFQTPPGLADAMCALLARRGVRPITLVEPTCGLGNLLFAGLDQFGSVEAAVGADINSQSILQAEAVRQRRPDSAKVRLVEANFFHTDWERMIGGLREPILVVGNLPWVTSAHLSMLGSNNLPAKSNFQGRKGLDAITGKANFDISEWMLIRLLEAMNGRRGTLAMLCKASVARKTLHHAWNNQIALEAAAIYQIDAAQHFEAHVGAALLVVHFGPGADGRKASVYPHLSDADEPTEIGCQDGLLLADVSAYHRWLHLYASGEEMLRWRSGIKHDCSKVMELRKENSRYRNGLGERIELEDDYVYPLLKSSEVANAGRGHSGRYMLITQTMVGEDTAGIREKAPKTWTYLVSHAELLNRRASSIYRKRPPFSIFGVGPYSFAPWKIAISGFYKKLAFAAVGPIDGKPVVFDDTVYFLPCQTKDQADYLTALLNSAPAQSFYSAFIFWDGKRPITAELLRRLDLRQLARELRTEEEFDRVLGKWLTSENGFWKLWQDESKREVS